jgi:hypothetical protein
MFPSASRVASSEFRYNFVEHFERGAPMMRKLKSRMRIFAHKIKASRAAHDRCAHFLARPDTQLTRSFRSLSPSSPDPADELARLRSANADLRV